MIQTIEVVEGDQDIVPVIEATTETTAAETAEISSVIEANEAPVVAQPVMASPEPIIEPVSGFQIDEAPEADSTEDASDDVAQGNPLGINIQTFFAEQLPSSTEIIESLTQTGATIASDIMLVSEIAAIDADAVNAPTLHTQVAERYAGLPNIYLQMLLDAFDDCEGTE